jgi:pyruvate dehydrogenase (quinone)
MPPPPTIDEAYHFGMFTMRAILDGRARELIDHARVNVTR